MPGQKGDKGDKGEKGDQGPPNTMNLVVNTRVTRPVDTPTIYGSGFPPQGDVLVELTVTTTAGERRGLSCNPVKANLDGFFQCSIAIPPLTAPGGYVFRASVGGNVVATAPIFIESP